MKVKLLTVWVGKYPEYVRDFVLRGQAIDVADWEPLRFLDVEQVNQFVTERLGVPCRKQDGYALSDIRPMLADLFPDIVAGYEWWGWVELDVVLGDLDNLLPPLLDRHDAISAFPRTVSGPMMLFRNVAACNKLFKHGNWRTVLAEPSYCNFEEVSGAHVAGFHKDGGMTKLLKESGLRVHWDDRHSLRYETDPAHAIPAGCQLEGNRLIETPTGRELLLYHFNHTKRWPI